MSTKKEMLSLTATAVVELLRNGEVTPLQLIDEVESRWKELDPSINAIPIPCFLRAREKARSLVIPETPGTKATKQKH
jgi:amidase